MRLLVHTVLALMIVGLLGGVVYLQRQSNSSGADLALTRSEVHRFQQQIHLQAALADGESRERAYPASVEPAWFQGKLPRNVLLTGNHPWLEIADERDGYRRHPAQRTTNTPDLAAFWYNPFNGVVRARVPVGISDRQALEAYNFVNDSSLDNLFTEEQ